MTRPTVSDPRPPGSALSAPESAETRLVGTERRPGGLGGPHRGVQPRDNPNPKENPMPARIQRRRTKGWRLPENTVIVSRPSRFGNPFTIKDAIEAEWSEPHRACADNYAEWLRVGTAGGWYQQTYRIGRQVFDRCRVLAEIHLLRGKDLACTCPLPADGEPDHCHAAVLIALANA